MLSKIDQWLGKLSPALHKTIKERYRMFKKKTITKLSKTEFISILNDQLEIREGDTVFVHSSMRNLYLDFDKQEILPTLIDIVGPSGTLLFPCWQFNTRAADYIAQHDIIFDIRNTPSAMGKLPDELRMNPKAHRSFHPTNSVIAIGAKSIDLVEGHESDIYPCGEKSPFFKLIKAEAKILGIGVTVDNLTFVHTIEDTIKEAFPIKTREDKIYSCKCIDENGDEKIVDTLVASTAISQRDVYGFFKKFISRNIYKPIRINNMDFFSLKAPETYVELKELALKNLSIYRF
jgi:aminoglycoside 3-N-acetyltransferase